MEQSAYSNLTGFTLTTEQAASFDAVRDNAQSELESMLGYPLDPSDWDNQYLEIGISRDECACPDETATDLDEPDEVEGAYRLFNWNSADKYLAIDPATRIYKVKLVQDGVTYKVFDPGDYSVRWVNSTEPYTKFLAQFNWNDLICMCGCWHTNNSHMYQLAVDADWAFEELPNVLNKLWADLIHDLYDTKRDIQSESITSYSYTRFNRSVTDKYSSILSRYRGPNGIR